MEKLHPSEILRVDSFSSAKTNKSQSLKEITSSQVQDEFISIPLNITISRKNLEESLRTGKPINANLAASEKESAVSSDKVTSEKKDKKKVSVPTVETKNIIKDTTTGTMRAYSVVGDSSTAKGVFGVPMMIDGGDLLFTSSRQLKKIQEMEKEGITSFQIGEEVVNAKTAKNRAKESLVMGMLQAAGGLGLTVALVTGNIPVAYGALGLFGGLFAYRVGKSVQIIGPKEIIQGTKEKISDMGNSFKEQLTKIKEKISSSSASPPKYLTDGEIAEER